MFLKGIDRAYKRHLDNNFVGVINGSFWKVFNGFLTKYGKVKPLDLEANTVRMNKGYEAADPIEALFAQINDAQEFWIFAGYPLTDEDLVLTAEVLILSTNQFIAEYKNWRWLYEVDRTWEFFKSGGKKLTIYAKKQKQRPHPLDMELTSKLQTKAATIRLSMKRFRILVQHSQQTQARSHSLRRQTRSWELTFRKISLLYRNRLMTWAH